MYVRLPSLADSAWLAMATRATELASLVLKVVTDGPEAPKVGSNGTIDEVRQSFLHLSCMCSLLVNQCLCCIGSVWFGSWLVECCMI